MIFKNQSGVHGSLGYLCHNQQWDDWQITAWPSRRARMWKPIFTGGSSSSPSRRSFSGGRSRITTPSKQGSPTGRPPSCQEQGRVSLPPSDWLLPVLLPSHWSSRARGLGWTRRLGWTRARDRVCRVGGWGQCGR